MIPDIFFVIVLIPLTVINTVLTAITAQFTNFIPDQIYTSITTLLSYLGILQGVFPIDTFFICLNTLLVFFLMMYTIKVAVFIWHFVPWIGDKAPYFKSK